MSFVRNRSDFAVGLAYVVAGAAFALAARRYELGTADQMGAGYFPFWLGLLLAVLGVSVMLRAADQRSRSSAIEHWDWRSLVWIGGALVLFALLLKPLGLAVSLALLIVGSSLASHEFRWRGTLLLTAVLLLMNVGIFVYVLTLPLPVWPAFVGP
ncbi:MAG: tripartite tricarboxylate transporter TctB family protein [Burkholderiales bacterium]|nr:tripartite tricarboxylate transporter TctB family protein [Burkholderiales bacterium]